jgi:hypothetical protein
MSITMDEVIYPKKELGEREKRKKKEEKKKKKKEKKTPYLCELALNAEFFSRHQALRVWATACWVKSRRNCE